MASLKNSIRSVLMAATAAAILSTAVQADTLRVIADGDLRNVDPIVTTQGTTLVHAYLIYDKLFEFNKDGVAQPALADKVDVSADNLTYTIKLREGLKFSDGGNLTTDDVIQSLKRWASRDATGQLMASRIKEMVKVDDLTFRISLAETFSVPDALAGVVGNPPFIMPKRVASIPGTEQLTDATGSGPYQFDLAAWKPGQTRNYVKNPHYVPRKEEPSFYAGRKEATFDKVEVLYIPDANTALAAMMTKKVDIWTAPPPDSSLALRGNSNVVVAMGHPLQGVIRPNHLLPPFNNPKAREALTYLVDQEQLNLVTVGDKELWRVCYAYLTCDSKYGDEAAYSGHRGKADLDKAKKLFQEAGYDGKPIVILDPTDVSTFHASALYLAQQLRKIGVKVDVQSMDWSTMTSRRTSKSPTTEGGWNLMAALMEGQPASSPLTHLMLPASCDKAWFGWPCDSSLEDLRAAFIREPDEAKRKMIASDLQKRASVVLPFVLGGEYNRPVVYGTDIEGFNATAPRVYFWNVKRKSK